MPYINIFDKNIYYEIYGEENENALLYLHGGPGASCLDFVNQAKMLSKKIKVIIFDQLGVLRSDAIDENEEYSMSVQVEMIEEMRKKLFVKKLSVLGHSYGGSLATLYAYTYPDCVNKIILDCPSLNFIDSSKSVAYYLTDYMYKSHNSEAIELCEKIKKTEYKDKQVIFDILTLLDYVKDNQLRNYLHNITFEEYSKSLQTDNITKDMWAKGERHLMKLIDDGKMLENFLPIIKKAEKPVLLINGKYDPACGKNQISYMLNNVNDIKQVIFENSGHFPRIEEPEKYSKYILEFLE